MGSRTRTNEKFHMIPPAIIVCAVRVCFLSMNFVFLFFPGQSVPVIAARGSEVDRMAARMAAAPAAPAAAAPPAAAVHVHVDDANPWAEMSALEFDLTLVLSLVFPFGVVGADHRGPQEVLISRIRNCAHPRWS